MADDASVTLTVEPLDSPALDSVSTDAPVMLVASSLGDGQKRYRVLKTLGRGGMGEVVLSLDQRIGRRVAVKRSVSGAGGHERFFREICVQGQLEHPTVVPLYDVGTDAQGDVSFTMKHIRGRTLRNILDALEQGDRATADAFTRHKLLSAFASVCQGVAFAHSRGVVHRDLKPDNLMLGEFGEVYVLDWGVARILSSAEGAIEEKLSAPTDDGSTREGSVIGSPGYMAPEQGRGVIAELDARADVYALGAILFELLTLQRLHPGATGKERLESTLAGADARASVRAPSRDVPPELEAVCVRATAQLEADRYASARELHEAVERYLNDDRDLELRRSIAVRHAKAANDAASKLGTPADTGDLRKAALSEAGRALALDPANLDARRAMFRLLTEAPREIPPEAQEEISLSIDRRRWEGAKLGATLPLIIWACVPFMLKIGVRSAAPFVAFYGFVALFMLACVYARKVKRRSNGLVMFLAVLDVLPYLALGFAFGPLVVIPSFCIMNAVVFQIYLERHYARTIVLAVLPMLLPLIGGWLGLLEAPYAFGPDGLLVKARMLDLHDPTSTTLLLLAFNVSALLVAGVAIARDRASLLRAERQLIVNAWQLRQMLPQD